jgi:TonB family protein
VTLRWVKHSAGIGILLACVVPSTIWSQATSVQDQLDGMYKGKVMLLRNFCSGNDLRYDGNGVLQGPAAQVPWSLAGVQVTDIALTAHEIEIAGNRVGFWYRGGNRELVRVSKLKIHVAKGLSDADSTAEVNAALSKVFMQSGEDLRPMVPEYWKYYLSGGDLKSRSAAWRSALDKKLPKTDTAEHSPAGAASAPVVIHSPDPKYTREAFAHHIEGVSRLSIVIDNTGVVSDVAILEPLGMGLDEQAVLAVKQWKFRPAMKNGEPVYVQIKVDMVFRCCP